MMTYDVILADPPWFYTKSHTPWGNADKFYITMSDEDIFSLPIHDMLASPGVVFLWATGPKLHTAIHAIERWGLFYRGVAFVWIKTTQAGVPIRAQGVQPSIIKPLTEFVLAASTQEFGRPLPLASEAVIQTIFAPRREHSRKPDEVVQRIDEMYPKFRKLEMFARSQPRTGWDLHGDEIGKEFRS